MIQTDLHTSEHFYSDFLGHLTSLHLTLFSNEDLMKTNWHLINLLQSKKNSLNSDSLTLLVSRYILLEKDF